MWVTETSMEVTIAVKFHSGGNIDAYSHVVPTTGSKGESILDLDRSNDDQEDTGDSMSIWMQM